MAKVLCFLLAVLCGLASINVSFAEPSTTYGAAPPANKYPAAPPPKYEPPSPPSPPAPPAQYETPTTSEKPKYEEMKKEEYKQEEKPAEYKKEEKMPEYGGGKKYRRSINDDEEEEEQVQSDPIRLTMRNDVVRDAVIMKLLSDPRFSGFNAKPISRLGSALIGRADPFSMVNDPGLWNTLKNIASVVLRDDSYSSVNDPGLFGAVRMGAKILRHVLGDERAYRNMGLSRKQAKRVRDAVMDGRWMDGKWMDDRWMDGSMAAENDPRFGKKFGKALAKELAGAAGSFVGSQVRSGDSFSVSLQDLVEMYGSDPAKGKIYYPRRNDGRLWLADDEEIFMDDDVDF